MKKLLFSLLFAFVALVMACGNRAEARVAVSINLGCPRVCMPCPPPPCYHPCPPAYYDGYYPCPPRYCAPCPPHRGAAPKHCHVSRPHIHEVYPRPRAPHHAPRGHARRR